MSRMCFGTEAWYLGSARYSTWAGHRGGQREGWLRLGDIGGHLGEMAVPGLGLEREGKRRAKQSEQRRPGHAQDARTDLIHPLAPRDSATLSTPLHLCATLADSSAHGQGHHQVCCAGLRRRQQQAWALVV